MAVFDLITGGPTYSVFTGASSGAAGSTGLVPQPLAGQQTYLLSGASTWVPAPSNSGTTQVITQSNSFSALPTIQWVYMNGTTYTLTNATAASTSDTVGLVVAAPSGSTFTVQSGGYVTGLSGLTAGASYWLDDATPGNMVSTPPSTAGHIQKPVFIADTTTSGWIVIGLGVVVGSALASATQAQVEAASSTTTYLSPGNAQYHPMIPKVWCYVTQSAGTYTLQDSGNVSSISKTSTGVVQINFTTSLTDANYCAVPVTDTADVNANTTTRNTANCTVTMKSAVVSPVATDSNFNLIIMGPM